MVQNKLHTMSNYTINLSDKNLFRYSDKIKFINYVDPYTIPKEVFSYEKNTLPNVELMDIYMLILC